MHTVKPLDKADDPPQPTRPRIAFGIRKHQIRRLRFSLRIGEARNRGGRIISAIICGFRLDRTGGMPFAESLDPKEKCFRQNDSI